MSACFSMTSTISNHPVAGSIMVRQSKVNLSSPSPNVYGPIRSMHNVCQGIVSGFLGTNLPYLICLGFCFLQMAHPLLHRLTLLRRPSQQWCCPMVSSIRVSPGCRRCKWYHSVTFSCSFFGTTIFSFLVSSRYSLSPCQWTVVEHCSGVSLNFF